MSVYIVLLWTYNSLTWLLEGVCVSSSMESALALVSDLRGDPVDAGVEDDGKTELVVALGADTGFAWVVVFAVVHIFQQVIKWQGVLHCDIYFLASH